MTTLGPRAIEAGTFALFRQNARLSHQRDGHAMPHDDMLRAMWEVVGSDSEVTQGWRDDAVAVLEAAAPFMREAPDAR